MLRRLSEYIFKEFFKEIIDDFENRIRKLEDENLLLKKQVDDNICIMKDISDDTKVNTIMAAKMEGTIKAILHLSKEKIKTLNDGTNK